MCACACPLSKTRRIKCLGFCPKIAKFLMKRKKTALKQSSEMLNFRFPSRLQLNFVWCVRPHNIRRTKATKVACVPCKRHAHFNVVNHPIKSSWKAYFRLRFRTYLEVLFAKWTCTNVKWCLTTQMHRGLFFRRVTWARVCSIRNANVRRNEQNSKTWNSCVE